VAARCRGAKPERPATTATTAHPAVVAAAQHACRLRHAEQAPTSETTVGKRRHRARARFWRLRGGRNRWLSTTR
jgi:hypothetical protein